MCKLQHLLWEINLSLTNADCTIMATDTKDTEENLNLSSIVIRMTYGGNSFLFMGDAEAEVEEARNCNLQTF